MAFDGKIGEEGSREDDNEDDNDAYDADDG